MSLSVPFKDVKSQTPGASIIVTSKGGGVSLDLKPINVPESANLGASEDEGKSQVSAVSNQTKPGLGGLFGMLKMSQATAGQ